jgi:ATP-dependent DNA helicase RecQ
LKHAHDKLKTFGVGRDHTAPEWRSIFRQLQATDLIGQDVTEDGRWFVTERGRRVLSGEDDVMLRLETERRPTERIAVAAPAAGLTSGQQNLLATLKARRLELARQERQPAYVIFADRTLIDMAQKQPQTLAQMSEVHGIGETKLARYGQIFLDIVRSHQG